MTGEHSDSGPSDGTYRPKDAITNTINAIMLTGGAGLVVSGVQNTLARENRGLFGVFTRTGGTIGLFAAMGGTYAFIKDASANLREKEDPWNAGLGGFFAGAMLGVPSGRIPRVFGYGAGLAILVATFEGSGSHFRGSRWKEGYIDEIVRKDEIRTTRRRPFEETIAEVGEGRGIYGPGYPERRRALLKEKYGLDIPAKPEKPYAA
ncbi:hypothetical protein H072_566 [Dactylellina haptotyla CBS 200.50]|uniref:Uncharacterized protein n=1 Tax=Dactylellina haptotyla (strain CBS 200.50) TaxID=1284197 RepID=S8C122_DACHA|nr:hypothetical protein H072_566 [Dactylellina haptotyla CBS 200.50]